MKKPAPKSVETYQFPASSFCDRRLAITSDILTGAALIAAGTTLYFTLTAKRHEPSDAPHSELRIGPGTVGLAGAF